AWSLVCLVSLLAACSKLETTGPPGIATDQNRSALASISSEDLLRHIKTLASDEFEGRAPGTPGEEKTVNYLTDEFKKLGLKPGNPDGTYIQKVPLAGFTPQPAMSFNIGGKTFK